MWLRCGCCLELTWWVLLMYTVCFVIVFWLKEFCLFVCCFSLLVCFGCVIGYCYDLWFWVVGVDLDLLVCLCFDYGYFWYVCLFMLCFVLWILICLFICCFVDVCYLVIFDLFLACYYVVLTFVYFSLLYLVS